MPVTRSAKIALRKSKRYQSHNRIHKARIKKANKEIRKLISSGKPKEAEAKLKEFYKFVDKAAKEKVIKKNTAGRLKSRLTKAIKKAAK
ncbi:30S ribosomal protein S20 [Candidatus Parcubacteria bacterium]|nr:MAG: 30S ribosomal protein S20 [Candidatus Parcubacteria bacterium]